MMIFRLVKTILFAFFALTVSTVSAACACCAPVDGGHYEKLHGKSSSGDNAHMSCGKMRASFMPEHHSSAPRAPCEENCRQCAPAYVKVIHRAGSFSIETRQWVEKPIAANAAAGVRRAGLSVKQFAFGLWRMPPGKTPIDLKIRLLT